MNLSVYSADNQSTFISAANVNQRSYPGLKKLNDPRFYQAATFGLSE